MPESILLCVTELLDMGIHLGTIALSREARATCDCDDKKPMVFLGKPKKKLEKAKKIIAFHTFESKSNPNAKF